MVNALMDQPLDFQERVVIGAFLLHTLTHRKISTLQSPSRLCLGAIESNLHADVEPERWSPDGLRPPHDLYGFRIITLPYPVSVTPSDRERDHPAVVPSCCVVFHQVSHPQTFHNRAPPAENVSETEGSKLDLVESMMPLRRRPITALFAGSLTRGRESNTGRFGAENLIRGHVVKALHRAGGVCATDGCAVCAPGLEEECKALILHEKSNRIWELAANSVFCLEPPGDTLTRRAKPAPLQVRTRWLLTHSLSLSLPLLKPNQVALLRGRALGLRARHI